MISLTLLALVTAHQAADLPTWVDVQRWMHRDVRTLSSTYEEWTSGPPKEKDESQATIRRWIDGKRYRNELESDDKIQLAMASDGDQQWVAFPPAGIYVIDHDSKDPRKEEFVAPKEDPDDEDGTFTFTFNNYADIHLKIKPTPVATKLEETNEERRLTLESRMPDRKLTIELRFEKEKWLLKRISAESSDKKVSMLLERTKSERGKPIDASIFALDSKVIAGLRELTGQEKEEFEKMFKSGGDGSVRLNDRFPW